jgi:hypothetical protein
MARFPLIAMEMETVDTESGFLSLAFRISQAIASMVTNTHWQCWSSVERPYTVFFRNAL